MYAQDYDETMSSYWNAGTLHWQYQLEAYIKNTQMLECPSNKSFWSYHYNYSYLDFCSMGAVESPSETVMFSEGGLNDATPPVFVASRAHMNPPSQDTYTSISRPKPSHNGGSNIVFVDGHAKWMGISQFYGVFNGTDYSGLTPQNKFFDLL